MPMRSVVLLLTAAFALAPLRSARAGCTTTTDAATVRRSVAHAMTCDDRKLRRGPGATCKPVTPPDCAGTLVTDAVALAHGPNNPAAGAVNTRALKTQLACQKRIGRGVSTYVSRKLRGLVRGDDVVKLQARARKRLDQIPDRCLVDVAENAGKGIVVPAAGPPRAWAG